MNRIFTPDDIATGLKVSKLAVYKWLQKGELKGFKAGKMWRVTREDLESFLGRSIPWEDDDRDIISATKAHNKTPNK